MATPSAGVLAIADGVTTGLSSQSTITRYRFGSSAAVSKAKNALLNKELIEVRNGHSYFLDPVYGRWFRHFVQK